MEFKPDWEDAKKRMEAFWHGEILDRMPIQVTAPRGPVREVPIPEDLEERWTSAGHVIEWNLARFEATYFGGEAFPRIFVNLGPSIIGAYLGCPLHLQEGTNWQEAIVEDWDAWEVPPLDPENRWWKATRALTRAAAEASRGRYIVTHTDMGDVSDVMSYLRGPERLCMDFVDNIHALKRVSRAILSVWKQVFDDLEAILSPHQEGTASWLGVWSPGRTTTLQSDFSGMISPAMYREVILPCTEEQARWVDHNLYHLDGVGAIPHLDLLLESPDVQGIQWTPGAGQPGALAWIDLYRRCQDAGKLLHIGIRANEIETLLEALDPRGIILRTSCESVAEADALLERAKTWKPRGRMAFRR